MADGEAMPAVADVQAYINENFGSDDSPPATPDVQPEPAADPAVAQTTPEAPEAVEPPAAPVDDLPTPDLSDLDPAQRAYAEQRLVEMRRKITEATTEAADYRRIAESVGGLENLQGLVSEIQAIQADPRGSVAQNLYQTLKGQFEAQGADPAQAAAQAAEQVDNLAESDYSDIDLPPEVLAKLARVDSLDSRMAAFEQAQAQEAEARARAEFDARSQADLMDQWGKLETAFPDLKGDEKALDRITRFAYSTGGNLAQAHDLYRETWNDAQAALHNAAANVPGGITTPPAGASNSQEPREYSDIEDPNLREDAIAYIERLNAQQG